MVSRILWILVALLATVLLVPQLRERVRPQMEYALNPIYRWEARNRVKTLQHTLERERSEGNALPPARTFTQFIAAREGPEAAMDPWDQPYYLVSTRRTFRVGSPGPDRRRNTADDILSEAEALAPSGPRR